MSRSKANQDKLASLQSASQSTTESQALESTLYRHHLRTAIAGTDPRADALMKEAAKTLRFTLFSGSADQKYEKAADLFSQAGAVYKMNENFIESAEALIKAAELYETKIKNTVEACVCYASAAKSYRECDVEKALATYALCVALHIEHSRHESAARVYGEMADIAEAEGMQEKCLEFILAATDCFESSDMLANAVQYYARAAKMLIDQGSYLKAGDLYEKCGLVSVERSINKGTIHEYYYLAILCYFVDGATSREYSITLARAKYAQYARQDRKHEGTREFVLLKKCFEAWDDENVKGLTKAIFEFDKIKNIDERESQCWLKIKQALKDGPVEANQQGEEDQSDYT